MDINDLMRTMTPEQIQGEVNRGARFVVYQYCISLLVVTFRRSSAIQYLAAGEGGALKGLPYTLLSLLLGWWGVPWGLIYTPQVLYRNLSGGVNVTASVMASLSQRS